MWCQLKSAMCCVHLSQNWYAVQLLPGWALSIGKHDQPITCSHPFEDYQFDINGNSNSM